MACFLHAIGLGWIQSGWEWSWAQGSVIGVSFMVIMYNTRGMHGVIVRTTEYQSKPRLFGSFELHTKS